MSRRSKLVGQFQMHFITRLLSEAASVYKVGLECQQYHVHRTRGDGVNSII
jgi:hypothetical protein